MWSLIFISVGVFTFLVLVDIGYRVIGFEKIEFATLEILVFALVHNIYQGVFCFMHKGGLLMGATTVAIIVAVKIFILSFGIFWGYSIYLKEKAMLRKKIEIYFNSLKENSAIGMVPNGIHVLNNIQNIANEIIDVDIWNSPAKFPIFAGYKEHKKNQRKQIYDLLNDLAFIPKQFLPKDDQFIIAAEAKIHKTGLIIIICALILTVFLPLG